MSRQARWSLIMSFVFPSFPRLQVLMVAYVIAGILAIILYGIASTRPGQQIQTTGAANIRGEEKSAIERIVTFATSVVGGGFALYSFLLSIEQKRVEYSVKFIERWNNPSKEFTEYKDALYRASIQELEPANFIRGNLDDKQRVTRNQIKGLCDFCEEVSLAVRMRTADERTIKDFLELVVRLTWGSMYPWIDGERKTLQGYDALKPTIYKELEDVALRWKAEEAAEVALFELRKRKG